MEVLLGLFAILFLLTGPVAFVVAMVQRGRLRRVEERAALLDARLAELRASVVSARAAAPRAEAAGSPAWGTATAAPVATPPPMPTADRPAPPRPGSDDEPEHVEPAADADARDFDAADTVAPSTALGGEAADAHAGSAADPGAGTMPPDLVARPAPRPVFETTEAMRGPDVFERAVAIVKGWLFEGNVPVKLGLLVLMFGVAGALKYAADAGWLRLPIELRLAGIAAGAIAGLVWGLRTARERPAFGLSLQGGAIGILLLTVFAAFRRYELLAPMPAFALVVILVAGASVLAVRQNAPALAVLGFIGGYLAPVLISTGSGNHVALFSYFAVLNAAVFAIAWKRPWRALNLVGFVFTFAIGGLWGGKYYRPELFATVEPFLVLFFLFYVSIPVLYALAGRERNGKVDGTLLFGTPLLAFPMQVGLLEGDRYGLALSAIAVAAVFAGLATWAVRDTRLRQLAQSAAGMGVVFATLAVPLALSARWTSSAWALQGAGMVWLGLRQDRRLTRWSGLALLVAAGVAWCVSLFHEVPTLDVPDRFVFNAYALSLAILATGHLVAAWLYDRAGRAAPVAIALFLVGFGWWTVLGLREIDVNLDPASDATAIGLFAALTAVLAGALRAPLAWPRLSWPVAAASVAAMFAGFGALEPHDATWFEPLRAPWWVVVAALAFALRTLLSPPSALRWVTHLPLLVLVSWGVGVSLYRVGERQLGLGDGWLLPLGVAPVAALLVLALVRPERAGWPVGERFGEYRSAWLGIAGFVVGAAWLVAQFQPGDSTPLPWLPLLNPLELVLVASLAGAAIALRARGPKTALWLPWAAAALLTLTMAVLRAAHQLANLPWSPAILGERLAQVGLTVAWCVAGVVAWVLGSRRRNRPLWMCGAVLLGVVLLKLLIVDRQYIGNLTGIGSFVAVGLLLIAVGWLAPTPPREE